MTEAGPMSFDSADAASYLNQGLWDDIITHEMMHVLGFGTLWNTAPNRSVRDSGSVYRQGRIGRLSGRRSPRVRPIYRSRLAAAPEPPGRIGPKSALGNELMTPYINGTNNLSSFSLMSLADLGYHVQPLPWSGNSRQLRLPRRDHAR